MKNAIPIGALIAAILVAFGLNKCEVPAEMVGVVTKTITKTKFDTVYVPYKVEKTVISTEYIDKIRVIRDSFYTSSNWTIDTSLSEVSAMKDRWMAAYHAAENLQNENELLVEDKNSLVDILAQTTNELWIEKNKVTKDSVAYKKFKHGLSASYGVLIGSKPIYQLTYEKPLTPALSLTGGVMWNGKPGVTGGIKIMF
jgi:hypothetical protein